MILSSGDHFDKRTAWSLIYFLKYAYLNIEPIRKFWETPSRNNLDGLRSFKDRLSKNPMGFEFKIYSFLLGPFSLLKYLSP